MLIPLGQIATKLFIFLLDTQEDTSQAPFHLKGTTQIYGQQNVTELSWAFSIKDFYLPPLIPFLPSQRSCVDGSGIPK